MAQQALNVKLLGQWNDTSNIRVNSLNQRYNDVWGFVWNNKEYAVIGSTEGVHIIDVQSLKQVAFQPGNANGPTIVHRDYKVFKHYLYAVGEEGLAKLQVFDLSYLPDSIHLVYEFPNQGFFLSRNIFIDTATQILYACMVKSSSIGSHSMQLFSLQQPDAPNLLFSYDGVAPVHDVYVRNDTAYCSSSTYGYEVIDFKQHNANFQKLAELKFYPFQGYNHSSWVGKDFIGIMADETHGSPLKIIDLRNFENPQVVSTVFANEQDSNSIPHNPFLKNNFALVSYYFDGLQIFDISDPYKPQKVGYYDSYTAPSFKGFGGAWGCYPYLPSGKILLSDMQSGLLVLDASDAMKIDDTSNVQFEVLPNPFVQDLKILVSNDDSGYVQLNLYDLSGALVWAKNFQVESASSITVTLPIILSKGSYVLKVRTPNHQYERKIIKD